MYTRDGFITQDRIQIHQADVRVIHSEGFDPAGTGR